jgi:hypothetical protein
VRGGEGTGGSGGTGKGPGHLGGDPCRVWPPPRWPGPRGEAEGPGERRGGIVTEDVPRVASVTKTPGTSPGRAWESTNPTIPSRFLHGRGPAVEPFCPYTTERLHGAGRRGRNPQVIPTFVTDPARDTHLRGGRVAGSAGYAPPGRPDASRHEAFADVRRRVNAAAPDRPSARDPTQRAPSRASRRRPHPAGVASETPGTHLFSPPSPYSPFAVGPSPRFRAPSCTSLGPPFSGSGTMIWSKSRGATQSGKTSRASSKTLPTW